MLDFWTRGFTIKGIETRRNFWTNYLVWLALPSFILGMLQPSIEQNGLSSPIVNIIYIALSIYVLAALIPSITITVRRFHDINKTGWLFLIHFIPFIGTLIVLIMMGFPSNPNSKYKKNNL
ncbi:DUF805 domain-containing protein [Vagococcus fessus]|uniref:DUF805 domain-containing protein n=1 Tax=Vagococcus fessus TaxID=120370 RepID=A0A430A7I9_9ENTE|nr:DUF805 domain-containing protein [Vagococcus fessus]RSU03076.1 hypothetical protein CBF31_04995 [Vagococcus fessus]